MDEYELRKEKIKNLRAQGINPFPAKSRRTKTITDFLSSFDSAALSTATEFLAGRIKLKRLHGKLGFAQIEDEAGSIQMVVSHQEVGEKLYQFFMENVDVGDIVEVQGVPFITRRGEKSIMVRNMAILAKAIRALPEKWHGLVDQEERFRHRYLDLIMNRETRRLFTKRAEFVRAIRQYLEGAGFVQHSMPVLEPLAGGADANPFVTHHDTLHIDLYLRICIELYQKRMIVSGFERVYDLGPVFRNEGMSREHLQEFTMLEFYWAYADYEQLMDFVEDFYVTVIQQVFGTLTIKYEDQVLNFNKPWPRKDYVELVKEETGIDLDLVRDIAELKKLIMNKKIEIDLTGVIGLGRAIDLLYKKFVRPSLVQPSLLINHPLAVSPLAKKHDKFPQRTQRFQVLAAGVEIGNGYSELNDPVDQLERFNEQQKMHDAGDKEAQQIDMDFINALEYGMAPTAGYGVGIERLFMICANQKSIRDVVLFPLMRSEDLLKKA